MFLAAANEEYRIQGNKLSLVSWEQNSNITEETTDRLRKATEEYATWRKDLGARARAQFENVVNFGEKRQFEKFIVIGTSALEKGDFEKFTDAGLIMKDRYGVAKVKVGGKDMALEPDLVDLFATSNDSALLEEAWIGWRDATGLVYRKNYIDFYKLGNKAAQMNSLPGKEFKTFDDLWMAEWETPDLKTQVDNLMNDLMPFYEKIHAYVRYHLKKTYPNSMPADGTIPAHLLGNMWAQQWGNLLNIIPEMNLEPDQKPIDEIVNKNLESKTVDEMFEYSETFFGDLGMDPMTQKFRVFSYLEKRPNVSMICHASAWDFNDPDRDDFRIKQCTEKTMNDLVTIHHEMGHVQYYMNYKDKEPIFRRGGNPGFHEAIGDLIALSVATPAHLQKVNLKFVSNLNPLTNFCFLDGLV